MGSAVKFEQVHRLDVSLMGPSYLSLRAECVVKVAMQGADALRLPEEVRTTTFKRERGPLKR